MFKRFLKILNIYEWIFFIVSLILLIVLGITDYKTPYDLLSLGSVIFGVIACVFNGKRQKWTFFFYSIYVVCYGVYSFLQKNYGEAILNVCINLPMYLYTLYKYYIRDRKKKESSNTDFKIQSVSWKYYLVIGIFIPLCTVGYGFLLKYLESSYPFINALATAFTLVAVFLTTKGVLHQWIFWNLLTITLLTLWSLTYVNNNNGLSIIVLNCIYLIINTYCYINWILLKRKQDKEIVEVNEENKD